MSSKQIWYLEDYRRFDMSEFIEVVHILIIYMDRVFLFLFSLHRLITVHIQLYYGQENHMLVGNTLHEGIIRVYILLSFSKSLASITLT